MNSVSVGGVTESSRDVAAIAGRVLRQQDDEHVEEAWFAEPPPSSTRRPSSIPPSGPVKVGEFLGDPDVDGWLR